MPICQTLPLARLPSVRRNAFHASGYAVRRIALSLARRHADNSPHRPKGCAMKPHSPVYRAAARHVERRLGFFIHLAVYLTVNTALVVGNLALYPHLPWALGPLI